ncbi:MAG: glycine-rich domain-containing protein [Nitrososphaera sp.]
MIDQGKAITVLGDNVCRACSKIFGTGVQCPSCRSSWHWQQPIFDYRRLDGLPIETIQALQWLELYKIPDGVVSRLVEKSAYSQMSAAEILEMIAEFKKFVALLVINHSKKRRVEMTNEEIDEIWHTFILFTKEYQEFCKMLVGEYIHHEPNVPADDVDQSAVRNYPSPGSRNFDEDYEKYFGNLNKVWETKRLDTTKKEEENKQAEKRNKALAITLAIDAILVLFLIKELFAAGHSAALAYGGLAYLPVLVGGVIWSRLTADAYSRKMVALAVMLTFATLLVTAVGLALHSAADETAKQVVIAISSLVFVISALLFAGLRVKNVKKKRTNGAWVGCGSLAGVSCSGSGGDGAGGGCGGGGCGG